MLQKLEIDILVIVNSSQQLLHIFLARLTRVGACAGVCNGICRYVMQLVVKLFLVDDADVGNHAIFESQQHQTVLIVQIQYYITQIQQWQTLQYAFDLTESI